MADKVEENVHKSLSSTDKTAAPRKSKKISVKQQQTLPKWRTLEIVSTSKPAGFIHPTTAIIRDTETGETYEWNARAHRKKRHPWHIDKTKLAKQSKAHFRIWCWEPHIVTWWLNVFNCIANAFWTIGGGFATWPDINPDAAAIVSYAANITACLAMILACYFQYVEAINHSHEDIVLPEPGLKHKKHRIFVRPAKCYGKYRSPLGHENHGLDNERVRKRLLSSGIPIMEVPETGNIILGIQQINNNNNNDEEKDGDETAMYFFDCDEEDDENQTLIGRKVNIRTANHIVAETTVDNVQIDLSKQEVYGYEWWTWHPAVHHIGVLLGLIGFLSAIVYLIPMCFSWPIAERGNASMGVQVFFVDVLQVLPYMAFTAVGHMYIAEAAGSWWKPRLDSIGYYVTVLNTIGAWGFLMCGALAIPVTIGSTCCPNMGKWGSAFSCFWGSASYFIGGVLAFIEFANPEPFTIRCRCNKNSNSSKTEVGENSEQGEG